jgi:hypothetical protein
VSKTNTAGREGPGDQGHRTHDELAESRFEQQEERDTGDELGDPKPARRICGST